MDTLKFLLIAFALVLSPASWAAYADASPAVGWKQGASGASTFNFTAPAANAAVFNNAGVNTVRTTASLNVGGRMVTMPAAMRFAANAGGVIGRAAFFNPAWFVAAGVAVSAYDWFTSKEYFVETENGVPVWKKSGGGLVCVSGCLEWRVSLSTLPSYYLTKELACSAAAYSPANVPSPYVVEGWYIHTDGVTCRQRYTNNAGGHWERFSGNLSSRSIPPYDQRTRIPATEAGMTADMQAAADDVAKGGMPARVPKVLPVDIPVEAPRLNPAPYPTGSPSPMLIPSGSPVLQPDGVTYRQPAVRVVPSPTVASPWQVELQPQEIAGPDPLGLPDPSVDPLAPTGSPTFTTPNGTTSVAPVPNPNPTSAPPGTTPAERTPQLCEVFPEILACAKLGSAPSSTAVPNSVTPLSVTKSTGFGPENGTCPAPRTAVVMGNTLSMSYGPICDMASGIRPIVIALAYLSAALSFMGFARKD